VRYPLEEGQRPRIHWLLRPRQLVGAFVFPDGRWIVGLSRNALRCRLSKIGIADEPEKAE
jgi:hypothetical protein